MHLTLTILSLLTSAGQGCVKGSFAGKKKRKCSKLVCASILHDYNYKLLLYFFRFYDQLCNKSYTYCISSCEKHINIS